ncbi:MAG: trypsin-like peptidase domain-containing protein [Acidobacteria bacterium]|nr:trypsin-like peptidase domain-containing protein [Acidobacteriota bacterium]MBI3657415.1 trypsin-like peptidase domain-containing protein [Acidobacteriota bacterium]
MESSDFKRIEKAKKLAAGPLGEHMSKFPLRFTKAVFFGERPSRKKTTRINNGTITLVNLGKGPIAMTCAHVISAYRKMIEELDNVIFQVGDVALDPIAQLIAEDTKLDLASIELTEEQVKSVTADGEIGSCVFEPVSWPPPTLKPGDFVALGGFPGGLRELPAHDEIVQGSWSCGGASVTTIDENRFSCQFEREYWVSPFGAEHHLELRDLGGMSGGPAFIHRDLYWDFVGIIYEFSPSFDIMYLRSARVVNADGSFRS